VKSGQAHPAGQISDQFASVWVQGESASRLTVGSQLGLGEGFVFRLPLNLKEGVQLERDGGDLREFIILGVLGISVGGRLVSISMVRTDSQGIVPQYEQHFVAGIVLHLKVNVEGERQTLETIVRHVREFGLEFPHTDVAKVYVRCDTRRFGADCIKRHRSTRQRKTVAVRPGDGLV